MIKESTTKKSTSSKDALIELQMLLMDQQRALESLSEQLIAQSDKVLLLEKKVKWLQSRFTLVDESIDQKPSIDDQKPPHY